ncbi:nucleotide-diphospho-sugar transferase, partial [Pelagophyceae sp. CCMP2097]
AFVTLVCDDESLVPAATLFASLQLARTEAQVVALVTPDVSAQGDLGAHLCSRRPLRFRRTPFERRQGALSKRLRKGCIYTKLRAWELTRFKRIVLLDSDILVTANLDTLFQRRRLSAVADAYPRIFNAGLIVLTPEKELAERLVGAASAYRSYDQGDQGFLNAYFQDHPTDALPKSDSAQGAVDGQGWVDGQGGVAWGQLDPKYNLPISTLNSRFGKPYQKHVTRKEEAIGCAGGVSGGGATPNEAVGKLQGNPPARETRRLGRRRARLWRCCTSAAN